MYQSIATFPYYGLKLHFVKQSGNAESRNENQ